MSVLMIGATERERIAAMIAHAKQNPVPLALISQAKHTTANHKGTLTLADREADLIRPKSQHIEFPGGIRAAFSMEEQPAGLYSHLSISAERKGKTPHPMAISMICQEFGVPFPPDHGWLEEFEPGHFAVNCVSLYEPAGRA
jgi:hypothetical protein